MTKIIENIDSVKKDLLVNLLKNSGVVLYPTDTQYGLGVIADNDEALEKLRKIKNRDREKPISIMVSDIEMLERYAVVENKTRELIEKYLPGALTLILPAKDLVLAKKLGRENFIGIRIPDMPLMLEVIKELNTPITTTSANISGENPCFTIEEILNQFGENADDIDLAIDNGVLDDKASTVVEIINNEINILRQGDVEL